MKIYKINVLFFLALFFYSNLKAQQTFIKVMPDTHNCSTIQAKDGDYILSTDLVDSVSGLVIPGLIKFDSLGNTNWVKWFSGPSNNYAGDLKELPNGDLLFITSKYLIKTNLLGNMLWSKKYSLSSNFDYTKIEVTNDGGFALCGVSQGFLSLLKLDSAGIVQWTKSTSAFSNTKFVSDLKQTSDSGFIIGGYENTTTTTNNQYLIKTDNQGNLVWNKTFGRMGDMVGVVIDTSDYIYTVSYDYMSITKWDPSGNLLWSKKLLCNNGDAHAINAILTKTNDVLICGSYERSGSTFPGIDMLAKIDSSGDVMYSRFRTYLADSWISSVFNTNDNHFISCGIGHNLGASPTSRWSLSTFYKMDSAANMSCFYQSDTCFSTPFSINVGTNSGLNLVSSNVGDSLVQLTQYATAVVAISQCLTIGIDEIDHDKIIVYTNPFNSILKLENTSEGGIIKILNIEGRLLHEFKSKDQVSEINLIDLKPGMYLVNYVHGRSIFYQKVIKF